MCFFSPVFVKSNVVHLSLHSHIIFLLFFLFYIWAYFLTSSFGSFVISLMNCLFFVVLCWSSVHHSYDWAHKIMFKAYIFPPKGQQHSSQWRRLDMSTECWLVDSLVWTGKEKSVKFIRERKKRWEKITPHNSGQFSLFSKLPLIHNRKGLCVLGHLSSLWHSATPPETAPVLT